MTRSNKLLEQFSRFTFGLTGLLFFYALTLDLINGIGGKKAFLTIVFIPLAAFVGIVVMKFRKEASAFLLKLGDKIGLKGALLIALALRLIWVGISGVEQTSDFADYDRMAHDILAGKYILNAAKPTGPSILFALHYRLFGANAIYPQITIALVSALQVALLYGLILQTRSDRRIAALGALALAVWPEHFLYVNLLGSDVLYGAGILAAVWAISLSRQKDGASSSGFLLLAGVILGVSQWVRPTALIFLLSALAFLFLDSKGGPLFRRLGGAGLLLASFFALVAPIILINRSHLGVPSPNPSQMGGWSLLVGTNLDAKGQWSKKDGPKLEAELQSRSPGKGEPEALFRDRIAKEIGIRQLKEGPLSFFLMALRHKISILWGQGGYLRWSVHHSRFKSAANYFYGVSDLWHKLLLALCAGILLASAIRRSNCWTIWQIYIFAAFLTTAMHFFLETASRYHHMFLPFLCFCASEGTFFARSCRKNENIDLSQKAAES